MARIFGINQQGKFTGGSLSLCMLALGFALIFLPMTTKACELNAPENPGDGGLMIHITGHSFQGNFLVITYAIDYPGMTKVKLYNGNNELLWRSQYVDDKEGEHKLVLKAAALNPGNYIFEFDYKNQIQSYAISM